MQGKCSEPSAQVLHSCMCIQAPTLPIQIHRSAECTCFDCRSYVWMMDVHNVVTVSQRLPWTPPPCGSWTFPPACTGPRAAAWRTGGSTVTTNFQVQELSTKFRNFTIYLDKASTVFLSSMDLCKPSLKNYIKVFRGRWGMNVFCVAETADDTDDSSMSLWLSQDDSFTFYSTLMVVSVYSPSTASSSPLSLLCGVTNRFIIIHSF